MDELTKMINDMIPLLRTTGDTPVYGPCPRCGQSAEYLDGTGDIVLCPICMPIALEMAVGEDDNGS